MGWPSRAIKEKKGEAGGHGAVYRPQSAHTTSMRTGVLIYVSLAERQAEIIADDGIASKTDHKVWQEAVRELTGRIDAGHPVDGFVAAIKRCGVALAEHYPPGNSNANEHPNHLIELD